MQTKTNKETETKNKVSSTIASWLECDGFADICAGSDSMRKFFNFLFCNLC